MTITEIRRKTAEIASHLAAVRALAREVRFGHPQGEALYRALQQGDLPTEHADPVGTVEDILQHTDYTSAQETRHEYVR